MDAALAGPEFLKWLRSGGTEPVAVNGQLLDGRLLERIAGRFVRGLAGAVGGVGLGGLDEPSDITALVEKWGPFFVKATALTPTQVDDLLVGWLVAAAKNPVVAELLFGLFFRKAVTPDTTDAELLDVLKSAAIAAAA
jgi:hypothetical protein